MNGFYGGLTEVKKQKIIIGALISYLWMKAHFAWAER